MQQSLSVVVCMFVLLCGLDSTQDAAQAQFGEGHAQCVWLYSSCKHLISHKVLYQCIVSVHTSSAEALCA